MAVRPKDRFEVFKRDGFTCAYCGHHPPDVTLEVDHIIPVKEGGSDDQENLVTACWDCNRGKGAKPLEAEPPALPDLKKRAELIKERERQLRAYHEARQEIVERREAQFDEAWTHWFDVWGRETMPRWHTPWESTLRTYIDKLGLAEVIEAMDIARARFNYISTNAVRYFAGVLKRKLAEAEGRLKLCTVCEKWIVLEPGEDTTSEWHHANCEKATNG
ncbi:MAG: HNH endonuclease [Bacteroidales bacterium]|nr:HNH endonuclease [Bacteroidales bacterium]